MRRKCTVKCMSRNVTSVFFCLTTNHSCQVCVICHIAYLDFKRKKKTSFKVNYPSKLSVSNKSQCLFLITGDVLRDYGQRTSVQLRYATNKNVIITRRFQPVIIRRTAFNVRHYGRRSWLRQYRNCLITTMMKLTRFMPA